MAAPVQPPTIRETHNAVLADIQRGNPDGRTVAQKTTQIGQNCLGVIELGKAAGRTRGLDPLDPARPTPEDNRINLVRNAYPGLSQALVLELANTLAGEIDRIYADNIDRDAIQHELDALNQEIVDMERAAGATDEHGNPLPEGTATAALREHDAINTVITGVDIANDNFTPAAKTLIQCSANASLQISALNIKKMKARLIEQRLQMLTEQETAITAAAARGARRSTYKASGIGGLVGAAATCVVVFRKEIAEFLPFTSTAIGATAAGVSLLAATPKPLRAAVVGGVGAAVAASSTGDLMAIGAAAVGGFAAGLLGAYPFASREGKEMIRRAGMYVGGVTAVGAALGYNYLSEEVQAWIRDNLLKINLQTVSLGLNVVQQYQIHRLTSSLERARGVRP